MIGICIIVTGCYDELMIRNDKMERMPGDDLYRFMAAQASTYRQALQEIKAGKKRTHWMWYVFPQLRGLGSSNFSVLYGIASLQEARDYLLHPVLGVRLKEISNALLRWKQRTATDILGRPDDRKLQSCMTLFSLAAGTNNEVFDEVLHVFFEGKRDEKTIQLLNEKAI